MRGTRSRRVARGSRLNATEAIHEGQLEEAIRLLEESIRGAPGNTGPRVLLCQVLAVCGDWPRATSQLDVIARLTEQAVPMKYAYSAAMAAEAAREEVIAGRATPRVLGEPLSWVAQLAEALRLEAAGELAAAERLRDSAASAAADTPGQLDDRPFRRLLDADARFGGCAEGIVNGEYYWIPWVHIRSVELQPPRDLFDFVWARGRITFATKSTTPALFPVRYPGSHLVTDADARMGRITRWEVSATGTHHPVGQRILLADQTESALLDIRAVSIGPPSREAAPTSSA